MRSTSSKAHFISFNVLRFSIDMEGHSMCSLLTINSAPQHKFHSSIARNHWTNVWAGPRSRLLTVALVSLRSIFPQPFRTNLNYFDRLAAVSRSHGITLNYSNEMRCYSRRRWKLSEPNLRRAFDLHPPNLICEQTTEFECVSSGAFPIFITMQTVDIHAIIQPSRTPNTEFTKNWWRN